MHPRQAIRHAVVAQLTGKTAAADRVFPERGNAFERAELPAIAVYVLVESVETERSRETAPRELDRRVQVVVEAVLQQADGVLDALDALCQQIEDALHADWELGGAAADLLLVATELGTKEDGRQRMGAARLEFEVRYFTEAVPAATLDDFKMADVQHGTLARDTVEVQS